MTTTLTRPFVFAQRYHRDGTPMNDTSPKYHTTPREWFVHCPKCMVLLAREDEGSAQAWVDTHTCFASASAPGMRVLEARPPETPAELGARLRQRIWDGDSLADIAKTEDLDLRTVRRVLGAPAIDIRAEGRIHRIETALRVHKTPFHTIAASEGTSVKSLADWLHSHNRRDLIPPGVYAKQKGNQ